MALKTGSFRAPGIAAGAFFRSPAAEKHFLSDPWRRRGLTYLSIYLSVSKKYVYVYIYMYICMCVYIEA